MFEYLTRKAKSLGVAISLFHANIADGLFIITHVSTPPSDEANSSSQIQSPNTSRTYLWHKPHLPVAVFEEPLPLCISRALRGPLAILTSHMNTQPSSPAEASRWEESGDHDSAKTGLEWERRMCVVEPDVMSHSVILHSAPPTEKIEKT